MSREHDQLYWQAFRFTADEMPTDEVREFERLLAEDQSAREAVARVVELSAAVAAVGEPVFARQSPAAAVVRVPSSVWMQPIGWLALGVAACLAVMLTLDQFRAALSEPPAVMVAGNGSNAPTLALAWYRTLDAAETATGEADYTAGVELEAPDAQPNNDSLAHADGPTPSWLLAAMSASGARSVPTTSPQN
ncbi:MAG TPA: hypothetical protein VG713_10730 [Pirellulales bacterium]|nr:hypothetical protein [Pirellulales bacterium]